MTLQETHTGLGVRATAEKQNGATLDSSALHVQSTIPKFRRSHTCHTLVMLQK